jgi:IS30 family transposase
VSYQQLTQEQRYQIWGFFRSGMNKSAIARSIGVHKATITRELNRNGSGRWKYNPSRAERMARERHRVKKKHRTAAETWVRVKWMLRQEWSPEEISVRLRVEGLPPVSHETIYLYIYRNKHAGGKLYSGSINTVNAEVGTPGGP